MSSPSADYSYGYTCDAWETTGSFVDKPQCCAAGTTYCADSGYPNFRPDTDPATGDPEPYSGTLAPGETLSLHLKCFGGHKVEKVNLTKNSDIKCNYTEQDDLSKIAYCHNKSSKSHHTWQLDAYHCAQ